MIVACGSASEEAVDDRAPRLIEAGDLDPYRGVTMNLFCRIALAILTVSLLIAGCGSSAEAPAGNTAVTFQAPVTYQLGAVRWDLCTNVVCPDMELCDVRIADGIILYPEGAPPVEAGTTVESFLDLPQSIDCDIEARIQNEDSLCVGTGSRPAGVEYATVPLEFECDPR
ncbi:MAG: hypothetical protein AAF997_10580 [Myxococcota bacterium]